MRHRIGIFWLAELILAMIAAGLVAFMFLGSNERQRVAVIVSDADSGSWERFIAGIKQGAIESNARIVITGTGVMTSAAEERTIIEEEIANGADAIIVQPASGEDTLTMLGEIRSRLPIMLVQDLPYGTGEWKDAQGELPIVTPDYAEVGTMLAEMLLDDYAGSLSGKTLGILTSNASMQSSEEVLQGLLDGIDTCGGEILWQLQASTTESEIEDALQGQARVDLIVALDTESLDAVGDLSEKGRLHGAIVYGVGSSDKAIYYLDHDDIAGLVIPNDYDMGYLAVQEIAQQLQHRMYRMRSQTVPAGVYRKEDLFLAENVDFLFVGTD